MSNTSNTPPRVPDGLAIRPVTEDEFSEWANATELPFFDEVGEDRLARWRRITDLNRSLGAFDGDKVVGGSLLLRMAITVPGGAEVAMGGLTAVGVLPTHRRRGILSALLQRHLEDMRDWGEPLSGLYASESVIYGRYGYGSAAPEMNWTIDKGDTAFRDRVETEGVVSLLSKEEALERFPPLYDALRAQRPGMPARTEAMWRNWVGEDPPEWRAGMSRKYLAIVDDRGYVIYRGTTGDWAHGLARGTMEVLEHVAVDSASAAALWRFVFDHDLISRFKVLHRPVDDVLPLLLANPRGLAGWQFDGMWLRPIDIARVLSARTYTVDGHVTIGVVDRRLPENTASWHLVGGPDGATCTRTDRGPDLVVDVADLGGAYLGNLRFARLARAGRAEELTSGAAARADAMFLTDPAPWCPQEF